MISPFSPFCKNKTLWRRPVLPICHHAWTNWKHDACFLKHSFLMYNEWMNKDSADSRLGFLIAFFLFFLCGQIQAAPDLGAVVVVSLVCGNEQRRQKRRLHHNTRAMSTWLDDRSFGFRWRFIGRVQPIWLTVFNCWYSRLDELFSSGKVTGISDTTKSIGLGRDRSRLFWPTQNKGEEHTWCNKETKITPPKQRSLHKRLFACDSIIWNSVLQVSVLHIKVKRDNLFIVVCWSP